MAQFSTDCKTKYYTQFLPFILPSVIQNSVYGEIRMSLAFLLGGAETRLVQPLIQSYTFPPTNQHSNHAYQVTSFPGLPTIQFSIAFNMKSLWLMPESKIRLLATTSDTLTLSDFTFRTDSCRQRGTHGEARGHLFTDNLAQP